MTKESIAKTPRGRTTRSPVNQRNILSVKGKDPGYVYRIVNDTGDRIQMFEEAGYELVDASAVTVGRHLRPSYQVLRFAGEAVGSDCAGGRARRLRRR